MFDLVQHYKAFQLKKPVAVTSSSQSSAVEIDAGVNDDLMAIIEMGAGGADATDKIDVIVEGSVDSGFTTPATMATFAQVVGTSTGGLAAAGFKRGLYKFFRLKWTVTSGNAPTFVLGGCILAGMAQRTSSLNSTTVA